MKSKQKLSNAIYTEEQKRAKLVYDLDCKIQKIKNKQLQDKKIFAKQKEVKREAHRIKQFSIK